MNLLQISLFTEADYGNTTNGKEGNLLRKSTCSKQLSPLRVSLKVIPFLETNPVASPHAQRFKNLSRYCSFFKHYATLYVNDPPT